MIFDYSKNEVNEWVKEALVFSLGWCCHTELIRPVLNFIFKKKNSFSFGSDVKRLLVSLFSRRVHHEISNLSQLLHVFRCFSVSYDDKEMTLSWHKENPVTVSKNIEIPSYTLASYRWFSDVEVFTTGNWDENPIISAFKGWFSLTKSLAQSTNANSLISLRNN